MQRNGLAVEGVARRILFFGDHGVRLQGRVDQQWAIATDSLSQADARRVAERTPARVRETLLPLRPGADPTTVAAAVQRWAGPN